MSKEYYQALTKCEEHYIIILDNGIGNINY